MKIPSFLNLISELGVILLRILQKMVLFCNYLTNSLTCGKKILILILSWSSECIIYKWMKMVWLV